MKELYAPSQISVHVGDGPKPVFGAQAVQLFAADTPSICRNDIALILLDRDLSDLPIIPVRLMKGTEPGEELRVVGYGVDETRHSGSRHTRSGLIVSEVGPSVFRDPGDSVPPRTFVTEGGALCIGDSGGPAFVDQTVITGVWSQVVGDCTTTSARNYFTEIAPFADGLVLPAFEAAGAEPWLEGNSGPGLTTGGTVGTGGGGNAGDTSTAGDGTTEGGTPGTGGSLSTGGLVGTGGDEPGAGASSLGGSDGLGGIASSGASGADGGLRKKGGCTCGVVGAPSGGSEFLLVPLAALALLRRRRAQLVR